MYNNIKLKPLTLVIGKKYMVSFDDCKSMHLCNFIKITEKGYNFLEENINKCLLKKHIYPSNINIKGMWFWIPEYIHIIECIPEKNNVVEFNKSTSLNYLTYKEFKIKNNKDYSWILYKKELID